MKFPVSIKAFFKGVIEYSRKKLTLVFDNKTFPKCSNKIEEIGRLRVRKYVVHCDGVGGVDFDEIASFDNQIEKLDKLRKKGLLTEDQFEQQKKKILDKFN